MNNDAQKTKAELLAEIEELRKQLRDSEDKSFSEAMNSLPQFIYEMDMEGNLVFANDAALQAFGYTLEDIKNGLELVSVIHEDSLDCALNNIQRMLRTGQDSQDEYLAQRKDGSTFPIKVYSKRVVQNGKMTGMRGVVIDITETKKVEDALSKSENFYRTLFENTGTAMVTTTPDSIISSCNSQFAELTGHPIDELVGKKRWSDFVDPLDLEKMTRYYSDRTKQGHRAPNNYQFTFISRSGEKKQVHVFVRMIPGTHDRICSLIDVSERVNVLEALRKSEERYKLVEQGANDGIWDWDLLTDKVYYSPRYKEILGYTDEEFPNTLASWKDSIHPEDIDRCIKENTRCVEGKVDQFEVQFRMRHKDGSYRWIHGRGGSVRDETGKPYRLSGMHTDITKRKQAEEALRESEERYRNMIEQANSGIYQSTPEGKFLNANTAMARIMGLNTPQELIESITDIGQQLWANPEERELHKQILDEKGSLQNEEIYAKRVDGTKMWVSENSRAIYDENGNVKYYDGFMHDITTQKISQTITHALYAISTAVNTTRDLKELYETIHAIIHQAIYAKNFFIALLDRKKDQLHFVYFVDEHDDYYTLDNISDPNTSSLTTTIFRTGEPMLISNTIPEDRAFMESVGMIGTSPAQWLGVPLKQGDTVVGAMAVQDYTNPRQYSDSEVAFMTAVSEQVAMAIGRKTDEEELTRLNEELEQIVDERTAELKTKAVELEKVNQQLLKMGEIKSSLVSSVSHELRTPLTSIRGFAKLCERDFSRHFLPLGKSDFLESRGNRISRNLQIIQTEGDRLTRLINDFLDINRIESGKAAWHDNVVDPCTIIKQAIRAASGSFDVESKVTVETILPPACRLVHADPDKIQQVVINLLNNAYKFTEQGTVTVTLTEGPHNLTLSVCDTGPGIPQEDIPHLFEKFHKSASGDTITNKHKGTGLGLAICKEIIGHYGGSIWVESTPGKGSCFSFSLPII